MKVSNKKWGERKKISETHQSFDYDITDIIKIYLHDKFNDTKKATNVLVLCTLVN
jgi:hypothetical protein